MKKKLVYVIIGLIIVTTISVFAIGPLNVMIFMVKPHHDFDPANVPPTPDFSVQSNWAALPEIEDPSDYRPRGIDADTLLRSVDVFFIHPTGYLKGDYWNSPMDTHSGTEENTTWMMANQASVFSDCNVYAPRYREATIYAFFDIENDNEKSALDLAYQDVERAFDYFISNYNKERPFIIASHSQGTFHAIRLIKNKIDESALAERMVAAYVIGMSSVTNDAIKELNNIAVCDDPAQTNCLVHWATFAEGSPKQKGWEPSMICVNPLSWKQNGGRVDKNLHQGYVKTSGTYNLSFRGKDKALDMNFPPLTEPVKNYTHALCKEGRLLVALQPNPTMALGEGNYHGLDFQLFHMNIRKNVSLRVRSYFHKMPL